MTARYIIEVILYKDIHLGWDCHMSSVGVCECGLAHQHSP